MRRPAIVTNAAVLVVIEVPGSHGAIGLKHRAQNAKPASTSRLTRARKRRCGHP